MSLEVPTSPANEDDREKWPERIVLAEGNEQQEEECHHILRRQWYACSLSETGC